MLTFDFERLRLGPQALVLDLGCGTGRHSREAKRRGARVVGCDLDLMAARATAETALTLAADGRALPFRDSTFDSVIVSEVLEHVADDRQVVAEAWRVLRPGGLLAASVPSWLPEQICWALSDQYHLVPGGHLRIYRPGQLEGRLRDGGFHLEGSHRAHALHAPYWWLRCLTGVDGAFWLARAYHRLLVWQIMRHPVWLDRVEATLNPILGKSSVLYALKPEGAGAEGIIAA